jgi:acetyltransferase-like isoleucine patch superfamily enzyme
MFISSRQIAKFFRLCFREYKIKFIHLQRRFALLDKGLAISATSIINYPDISRISCGKNCSIGNYSIIDISDDPATEDQRAKLTLGSYVYIGEQCNIRASGSEIIIGSQTMIANNVVIASANHKTTLGTPMFLQPWDRSNSGITIGEDCWICSNCTILPGTIIGDGSVIAGGSVVRGTVPPLSIWGGVPAKHLKSRTA